MTRAQNALYYLRRSFEIEPKYPQIVYGLSLAYKEPKDIDNAEMYFKKVLEMEAPGELHGLARNGLREIAAQEFKAAGLRMDAVFYLLDAMKTFKDKSFQEIQDITFEIGMLSKVRAGYQRSQVKPATKRYILLRTIYRSD
jgi:tetratricopeptide (TPR) repeat protein